MTRRAAGLDSHRVVLLGSTDTVMRTALDLARQPGHGYHVVGVALTDGPSERRRSRICRIVGGVDDVPDALRDLGADTVMATRATTFPPSASATSPGTSSRAATSWSSRRASPTSAARASTCVPSPGCR